MTTGTMTAARTKPPTADRSTTLLSGRTEGLAEHLARLGPLPGAHPELGSYWLREVELARLMGRGGGWFPTEQKLKSVLSAKRRNGPAVVIANGMEGEPESQKDSVLIHQNPHLVLDGVSVATTIVGATEAHVCVKSEGARARLDHALRERQGTGQDHVPIRIHLGPDRYVASEESALASWVGGAPAAPVFGTRPSQSGVADRPTLVQNVETLAHLALIARNGGSWFRSIGHPESPGTTLVTLAGNFHSRGVVEVPTGTTVSSIVAGAGGLAEAPSAWLTGGYGGSWVSGPDLLNTTWDPAGLQRVGGVMGASILLALPPHVCGIEMTERVLTWLADQSAGQCGPCVFGLNSVSNDFADLTSGGDARSRVEGRLSTIEGRGACRLPDGAVRFARSALSVFAEDLDAHRGGHCSAQVGRPSGSSRPGMAIRRKGDETR